MANTPTNTAKPSATAAKPADVVPEAVVTAAVPETKLEDSVVMAAAPEPDAPEPVNDTDTILTLVDGEDPNVANLKIQLQAFVAAASKPGNKPDDFKQSAQAALALTKAVLGLPRVEVLDLLLAFFEAHLDDVCAYEIYLQGSTTLSRIDEQQVSYLYNIFTALARKQNTRFNSGIILQILKKPEIMNYYDRKFSVIKANAA